MKQTNQLKTILALIQVFGILLVTQPEISGQKLDRAIEFPDIPGFLTLKCDFHTHSVLSDGSVWPNIRVEEAKRDGLDAISLTDHIEYQPHRNDIPHSDRNLGFQLTRMAAEGSNLMIINGAEITRSMPPGHFNAIFIQDVNNLKKDDVLEVFKEANHQQAFVFWNHPHWTSQQPDGIATLDEIHMKLISDGLIHGIEIYNEDTFSDEALQIALEYNLTILGNSDIHGLIDWQFNVAEGGHRPTTLVFAADRTTDAIRDALFLRRTAVWFDNTLVGASEFLVPLVQESLEVERLEKALVERLIIHNRSDASYIMENLSEFNLHNQSSVFTLPAHASTLIQVKTVQELDSYLLRFSVLNAITAPGKHPEIILEIK
jgi:histidinol phosphatase-like PHP family hydrolase